MLRDYLAGTTATDLLMSAQQSLEIKPTTVVMLMNSRVTLQKCVFWFMVGGSKGQWVQEGPKALFYIVTVFKLFASKSNQRFHVMDHRAKIKGNPCIKLIIIIFLHFFDKS